MKHLNRWVYAIIGVIVLLMAGLIYAWSVMSKPIAASRPEWTTAQLSLTFTIVMAFFCLGSLVAGILSKKVNPKIYVLLAGIFMFLGFFIASFTGDSRAMLYIGFGVLCGFGAGLAYNAVMGTICAWFPDKQGLISGILLMGFGLSSFIIGKVYTAMTPTDGTDNWQNTFKIFAVIILVVLVICCFFFVKPGKDFAPPAPKRKKTVREPACDVNTITMLKTRSFWLTYVWAIMVSAAGLALVGQASGIATEVGTTASDGTIATVVGMISIMNGIGRVIYGAMFDKVGYKLTMIVDMASFIIASLLLIAALTSGSFFLIIVGFLVGGFAYGGVTPMQSAIVSDFYGRTYYSVNFSVIVTNLLIGSFASTIAGKLYDMSQSYMSTIYMMIIVTVVSFIAFLGIRRPDPEKMKEKESKAKK